MVQKQTLDYPDSWSGRHARQLEPRRPVFDALLSCHHSRFAEQWRYRVPADFDLSVPNVTSQLRTFVETLKIEKICMSLAIL